MLLKRLIEEGGVETDVVADYDGAVEQGQKLLHDPGLGEAGGGFSGEDAVDLDRFVEWGGGLIDEPGAETSDLEFIFRYFEGREGKEAVLVEFEAGGFGVDDEEAEGVEGRFGREFGAGGVVVGGDEGVGVARAEEREHGVTCLVYDSAGSFEASLARPSNDA